MNSPISLSLCVVSYCLRLVRLRGRACVCGSVCVFICRVYVSVCVMEMLLHNVLNVHTCVVELFAQCAWHINGPHCYANYTRGT